MAFSVLADVKNIVTCAGSSLITKPKWLYKFTSSVCFQCLRQMLNDSLFAASCTRTTRFGSKLLEALFTKDRYHMLFEWLATQSRIDAAIVEEENTFRSPCTHRTVNQPE